MENQKPLHERLRNQDKTNVIEHPFRRRNRATPNVSERVRALLNDDAALRALDLEKAKPLYQAADLLDSYRFIARCFFDGKTLSLGVLKEYFPDEFTELEEDLA